MLRKIELLTIQPRIHPVVGDQLSMLALLCKRAVVQDKNTIGFSNGGEPVRNDEGRAALHQSLQGVHQEPLHVSIEGRCRLIEDQDRGMFQKGPSDREALLLTAR